MFDSARLPDPGLQRLLEVHTAADGQRLFCSGATGGAAEERGRVGENEDVSLM